MTEQSSERLIEKVRKDLGFIADCQILTIEIDLSQVEESMLRELLVEFFQKADSFDEQVKALLEPYYPEETDEMLKGYCFYVPQIFLEDMDEGLDFDFVMEEGDESEEEDESLPKEEYTEKPYAYTGYWQFNDYDTTFDLTLTFHEDTNINLETGKKLAALLHKFIGYYLPTDIVISKHKPVILAESRLTREEAISFRKTL